MNETDKKIDVWLTKTSPPAKPDWNDLSSRLDDLERTPAKPWWLSRPVMTTAGAAATATLAFTLYLKTPHPMTVSELDVIENLDMLEHLDMLEGLSQDDLILLAELEDL